MSRIADNQGSPEDISGRFAVGRFHVSRSGAILVAILLVAAALRCFQLGRLSFWYDEVVTIRLAQAASPRELFERLFQIDATRAPLHPLLLQAWTRVFGTSEDAARSLSVLCGLATVVLIYAIGRLALDGPTGLWAAWLAALSPALIVYSREARMYSWLVTVACLCWYFLFALTRSRNARNAIGYVIALAALVYSHPLGLLMMGALALAGLIGAKACFGSRVGWLIVHLVVILLFLPWVGNYLDHPPEFESGRLSPRFLLGTPIGFIGGNFVVLAGLIGMIALGVTWQSLPDDPKSGRTASSARWLAPAFLLAWLIVPPVSLYVYSMVSYPVFGPARYTVFVAPAYLILVAGGLRVLPAAARYPLAAGLAIISSLALGPLVYDPELKADWRTFAAAIAEGPTDRPRRPVVVIVASAEPTRNLEVETARYYLPVRCTVLASAAATAERLESIDPTDVFLAVGSRRGQLASPVPQRIGPYTFREIQRFDGLVVYRGVR